MRWTEAEGLRNLGTLNGGHYSMATAVSADGRVIVGVATDGHAGEVLRAFVWREETGMCGLGGLISRANAVSTDGSVVVGVASDGRAADEDRGFVWTAEGGMRTVEAWLYEHSLAAAAVPVVQATGVSADGQMLVGQLEGERAFVASVRPRWPLF